MPHLDNDARWFAENVQPHAQALRAYLVKRFPSLPDHEDLLQETFFRLLRAREAGQVRFSRAYLFVAARNTAIDSFRRQRRTAAEAVPEFESAQVPDTAPTQPERMDRQQQLELLKAALQDLPERCREVNLLRHVEGLSYREIAERLGVSVDTVKSHLLHGLRECTHYLRRRGLFGRPPHPR